MQSKTYFRLLPLAEAICNELFGKPKTAQQIAERYNQKKRVVDVLFKKEQEKFKGIEAYLQDTRSWVV